MKYKVLTICGKKDCKGCLNQHKDDLFYCEKEKVRKNIKIESNISNEGLCADFFKNGKKYYADIAYVPFVGTECMIFPYKEDGKIDWNNVYCRRDIPVTEESLVDCITEFMKGIQDG